MKAISAIAEQSVAYQIVTPVLIGKEHNPVFMLRTNGSGTDKNPASNPAGAKQVYNVVGNIFEIDNLVRDRQIHRGIRKPNN